MKKRILVLMTVVALMMVMLAMSVAPAFARGPGTGDCIQTWADLYGYWYAATVLCN
jgi:hypothetical protein